MILGFFSCNLVFAKIGKTLEMRRRDHLGCAKSRFGLANAIFASFAKREWQMVYIMYAARREKLQFVINLEKDESVL